jgi:ADP-ribosyl-[dinitrogen reductase] hydrolase
MTQSSAARDPVVGCLLGTAVADALGLPYEGLSRRRGQRIYGLPDRYRFCFGRGMVSDDTEHTCMVAQALLTSQGDVALFRRHLARHLRWWLIGVPAGIGMATLRAILRLWMGRNPQHSGVFSAGNGPAMRAAILGASIDDPDALRTFVKASTRITHTDPKAEFGALAVSLAAWSSRQSEPLNTDRYLQQLKEWFDGEGVELIELLEQAIASAQAGQTTEGFADALGLANGVSGYVYHTVPIAIHAWLAHPRDFRAAVMAVIACGGDTDSTGAIVGGIVGTTVGREGIPEEWLRGLLEWPRSVTWMERLGMQFAAGSASPPRLPWITVLPRNFFFLIVVLFHGFRRLLPPY